ncbi:MAG TPA: hypothetical protein VMN56_20665 [Casimicrobiaceae bacterium]|nr:hypothetical protein [Casimicrobiaceae bacterium]
MARQPLNPAELARLSGAMLQAMAEARALNDAGETGERFSACVSKARDHYDHLLAQLIAAEPATAQYARGLADSMGNHLSELERLLDPPSEAELE